MSSEIYGWYYSVPCLVLLVMLVAGVIFDLWLISRPTIGDDREQDVFERRVRTRHVLAVASGALLLHLSAVLLFLAATSSLGVSMPLVDGRADFVTSFAALGPALRVSSYAITVIGYALWIGVMLSAIPARRRARALVRA